MKRRGWATAVAVVTALLLTSCGSGADSEDASDGEVALTYLGDDVVDAEKTLAAADAVWDRTQAAWDQVLTIPDEARCYFLADVDGAVRKDGMCGPFRGLGSPEPEWVLLPFEPRSPEIGSVVLTPTSIIGYQKNPEYDSLRLVRADGTEGDRDLEVPEPSGWPKVMEPGHSAVAPMTQFNRSQRLKTRVRMLGHDYSVLVVGSTKAQFPDRSIYVPDEGGALVDFRFEPFDSSDAAEAQAALFNFVVEDRVTLLVTAGGRTYRGAYEITAPAGAAADAPARGASGFFGLPDDTDVSYAIVVKGERIELND